MAERHKRYIAAVDRRVQLHMQKVGSISSLWIVHVQPGPIHTDDQPARQSAGDASPSDHHRNQEMGREGAKAIVLRLTRPNDLQMERDTRCTAGMIARYKDILVCTEYVHATHLLSMTIKRIVVSKVISNAYGSS